MDQMYRYAHSPPTPPVLPLSQCSDYIVDFFNGGGGGGSQQGHLFQQITKRFILNNYTSLQNLRGGSSP